MRRYHGVCVRHFNTAGPNQPDISYTIPPLDRMDKDALLRLIDARRYFVLHAPRQTGKTSAMLALVKHLNETGRYTAVYANIEGAQALRNNVVEAMRVILSVLCDRARYHAKDLYPESIREEILSRTPADALRAMLAAWAEHSEKPICLILDEVDALIGDTLLSVLRQLRSGYDSRPEAFPQCIILCGVRDIRDYRIHSGGEIITGGSAFNIKVESLRLGDFTQADIRNLYEQHTAETGQPFDEAVYPLVWTLTQGQPWLVNALAYEICENLLRGDTRPITVDLILQAKEQLILKRVTHLDQLTDKLKEPRVQRVIEPIVNADDEKLAELALSDDAQYCIDLGLIRRGKAGLEIANGIYTEVIPRDLTFGMQDNFLASQRSEWYIKEDGRLDMPKLLDAFQQFFRENSEHWLERYEYKEAGPQLIMQAFLQRIVNGGGRIDREYGLGRRRTDLLIQWPGQRIVIELKLLRGTLEKTVAEGRQQIADYMDRSNATESHLVIFDRRKDVSWDEKIYKREEPAANGRPITIWGC